MTTEKQITANRANSQKSTGARTAEGKETISQNALKHGLLSERLITSTENAQDYFALLAGLVDSLNPIGMLETVLVERIAVALWRQKRLVTAESATLEIVKINQNKPMNLALEMLRGDESASKKEKEFAALKASAPIQNELMARYSVTLDNALYKAIEALRNQQEFRLKNNVIID